MVSNMQYYILISWEIHFIQFSFAIIDFGTLETFNANIFFYYQKTRFNVLMNTWSVIKVRSRLWGFRFVNSSSDWFRVPGVVSVWGKLLEFVYGDTGSNSVSTFITVGVAFRFSIYMSGFVFVVFIFMICLIWFLVFGLFELGHRFWLGVAVIESDP